VLLADQTLDAFPFGPVEDGTAASIALPVLEFTLNELWQTHVDGAMTSKSLNEIGGLSGSIPRWANEAIASLDPQEQELARFILVDLVYVVEGSEALKDARRRRQMSELAPHEKRITVGRGSAVRGSAVRGSG
jgi:conflict system STAND superfamily ATPase